MERIEGSRAVMRRSNSWVAALFGVTAIGLFATSSACAGDSKTAGPDLVLAEMGGEVFASRCAPCHGSSGVGDGPAAASLKVPPADLTRIAARRGGEFPDGEISRTIDGRFDIPAHGSREMPVWGERFSAVIPESGLGDEIARGQIVILVEYLKSIQQAD
jgi:mono/diheme cytochrome c family protein